MSTIKANNVATLAGVTSSMSDVVNGSARAWVNFNGTGTVAIRAAYNVSSITDNGVGDYTVNFTTALPDTNFAAIGSNQLDQTNTSAPQPGFSIHRSTTAKTTTSVRVSTGQISGGVYVVADNTTIDLAVFR